jgi:site-specific DNA-methyltransferase (adenine-specific)
MIPPESATAVGHPAPFPVALAERLIRFYAYPGAQILDPFAGSGSTGLAALRLGCRATLVDIDATYCTLARRRLERELSKQQPAAG